MFDHWGVGRSCRELVGCFGGDFSGHLQCDAYKVSETYAKNRSGVRLIACLAPIGRGFADSLKSGPCKHAALIIHLIRQLPNCAKKAVPALRESVRAWRSAPLVRDVADHAAQTPAGEPEGQGAGLPARAPGEIRALPRGRTVRQRPDQKRDAADEVGHEEPAFAKAMAARVAVHRKRCLSAMCASASRVSSSRVEFPVRT